MKYPEVFISEWMISFMRMFPNRQRGRVCYTVISFGWNTFVLSNSIFQVFSFLPNVPNLTAQTNIFMYNIGNAIPRNCLQTPAPPSPPPPCTITKVDVFIHSEMWAAWWPRSGFGPCRYKSGSEGREERWHKPPEETAGRVSVSKSSASHTCYSPGNGSTWRCPGVPPGICNDFAVCWCLTSVWCWSRPSDSTVCRPT